MESATNGTWNKTRSEGDGITCIGEPPIKELYRGSI